MLVAKSDNLSSKSIGDILGIDTTSLVHNRKFRNHLEHYDEKLSITSKGFIAIMCIFNHCLISVIIKT